jgi:hypothetical protein
MPKRSTSKEFTPAVDEAAYRDGSLENNALKKRRAKSETKAMIKEAASECSKFIEKNN